MTTSKIYKLSILDIFDDNTAAIIGTLYKWEEGLGFYVNSLIGSSRNEMETPNQEEFPFSLLQRGFSVAETP